jgi:hypothetical protein
MKIMLKAVAPIAFLLAACCPADAGQMFTPPMFIQDPDSMYCIVLNAGSASITVAIDFLDSAARSLKPQSVVTLAPGEAVLLGHGPDERESLFAYCKFSSPPYSVVGSIPSLRAQICVGDPSCKASADAR